MRRVFISHPYKNDPKGNKKRVDTICRELAERDDIFPRRVREGKGICHFPREKGYKKAW